MPSNTLKRDGTWVVELLLPLKTGTGAEVTEIVIRPPGFEHQIRWGRGEIPSTLALLSELSDQPERLLRTITYPDVDRVMLAFISMMPSNIQEDLKSGKAPLATPVEDLPEGPVVDQLDPRFPHVEGPVKRFPTPPVVNIPGKPAEDTGPKLAASPDAMKAV